MGTLSSAAALGNGQVGQVIAAGYTVAGTYYFDASDAGPTDSGAVWTDDANAFDGSTATVASTSDTNNNALVGEGTTAPTSGSTIAYVEFRQYAGTSASQSWQDWVPLKAPSGGWTWQKVNDLTVGLARSGIANSCNIYEDSTAGAVLGNSNFLEASGGYYVGRVEVRVYTANATEDLYMPAIPTGATDTVGMWKSANDGTTWTEQDTGNRPTSLTSSSVVDALAWVADGPYIHVIYGGDTATGKNAAGQFRYATFDTTTDTWTATDEQIDTPDWGATESTTIYGCDIAVRSDGDVVVVYRGTDRTNMGAAYTQVGYNVRTGGTWGGWQNMVQPSGEDLNNEQPRCVLGASDDTHITYRRAGTNTYGVTLSSADSLGTRADFVRNFALADIAYFTPSGGSATLGFVRGSDTGGLHEYSFLLESAFPGSISGQFEAYDDTTAASNNFPHAIAWDGITGDDRLYVLWGASADDDLYYDYVADGDVATNNFANTTEAEDAVTAQGVWATVYTDGSGNVDLGYIYDNAGTLTWGEVLLQAGVQTVAVGKASETETAQTVKRIGVVIDHDFIGTDGVTLTTSNATAPDKNIDSIFIGSGAEAKFSNLQTWGGGTSLQMQPSATGGSLQIRWTSITQFSQSHYVVRYYAWIDTAYDADTYNAYTAGGRWAAADGPNFYTTQTGQYWRSDDADLSQIGSSSPTKAKFGQWVRVEMAFSISATGYAEIKVFEDPNSTTASYTFGNLTGPINTDDSENAFAFGSPSGSAANPGTAKIYIDRFQLGVSDTAGDYGILGTLQQQVTVGKASETETAQAVAVKQGQNVTVGKASETETAQAVSPATTITVAVGAASETETAQATAAIADFVSTVAEVTIDAQSDPLDDSNHTVYLRAHVPTGTATIDVWLYEGTSTQIQTWQQALTNTETTYQFSVTNAASITDYADLRLRWQVIEDNGYLGTRVDELYLEAPSGGLIQNISVVLATETETAEPVTEVFDQTISVGVVSETEVAQPISVVTSTSIPVGVASESETAQVVTVAGSVTVSVAKHGEAETVYAVKAQQSYPIGAASEAESAQPVGADLSVPVSAASESETAGQVIAHQSKKVLPASSFDFAGPVPISISVGVGVASETETAVAVTPVAGVASITVTGTTETETAQPVNVATTITIAAGLATETETAQTVAADHTITVGVTAETETAVAITPLPGVVLVTAGVTSETETATAVLSYQTQILLPTANVSVSGWQPQGAASVWQAVELDDSSYAEPVNA